MDLVLLTNERAGSLDDELADQLRARIRPIDEIDMAGTDTAAVAREHPGARLVVAGGDGTLHVAVRELWEGEAVAGTELALIPTGTGNDFARGVGIPLDPDEAAELAASGAARPVDLLVSDKTVAVNAVHAGVGAEAARLAQPLKPVAGPAAYPLGAAAAAVTETGWQAAVTADGRPIPDFDGKALMVAVCNASSIGGGTPLCPGADPTDGQLDVVVAAATGPIERAAFGTALRRGTHLGRDDVVHVRAREVAITGDPMRYDIDGEVGEERPTSRWRVEPGVLRVVLPQRGRQLSRHRWGRRLRRHWEWTR